MEPEGSLRKNSTRELRILLPLSLHPLPPFCLVCLLTLKSQVGATGPPDASWLPIKQLEALRRVCTAYCLKANFLVTDCHCSAWSGATAVSRLRWSRAQPRCGWVSSAERSSRGRTGLWGPRWSPCVPSPKLPVREEGRCRADSDAAGHPAHRTRTQHWGRQA